MKRYADVLGRFWDDPGTFWVISSDFCHWYVLLTAIELDVGCRLTREAL